MAKLKFILGRVNRETNSKESISEGVNPLDRPLPDDAASTFSCRTGRYNSTIGDVLVIKVEDGLDDATIKTETTNSLRTSVSGRTSSTNSSHYSGPSTVSEGTLVADEVSTINANLDHDGNNYDILLRREKTLSSRKIADNQTQSGE